MDEYVVETMDLGTVAMAIIFEKALIKCIEEHGVHGPEMCNWYVLPAKMPDQCGDVLGAIGSVGWKLKE